MAIKTTTGNIAGAFTIFDDLPFGIIVTDFAGKIIHYNGKAEKMFFSGNRSPGGGLLANWMTGKSREQFEQFLEKVSRRTDKPEEYQTGCFHLLDDSSNERMLCLGPYKMKKDDAQVLIGFVPGETIPGTGPMREDLQEKKIEHLKHELQQEAELNDMKSRFISIASHEFRTPLSGITSSLNLIVRYIQADHQAWNRFKHHEKVEKHLTKIRESAKNLTSILGKFLSLNNMEQGEIPVRLRKLDPVKLLQKQVSQFEQLGKEGQQFLYQHEGGEQKLEIDRSIFRNIFNNLLSNASKFSPEGEAIRVRSSYKDGEFVVEVIDRGIGIPEEEYPKIFRRFYRAGNALSYADGTGLGLHIVGKYVGLLNGKITFESRESKGTTFRVSFPIVKE